MKDKKIKLCGIYIIVNKINRRIYIGSTVDFEFRKKTHIKKLNSKIHHNYKLQEDWERYTESDFEFNFFYPVTNKDELKKEEKTTIDRFIESEGVERLYNIILDPTVPYRLIRPEDKNTDGKTSYKTKDDVYTKEYNFMYADSINKIKKDIPDFFDRLVFYELSTMIQRPYNCVSINKEVPTYDELAKEMGVGLRRLVTAISKLEKLKLISILQAGHRKCIYVNPEYVSGSMKVDKHTLILFGLFQDDDK